MPEFRVFFEHTESRPPFSIWQNAHLYHSSANCTLVEAAQPELRCDDYIVLDANFGLKLRDSKGYLLDGSHKFKRLELKTRVQVDGKGGEIWDKQEIGRKPTKQFRTMEELDAFVIASVSNCPCSHLTQAPLSYVRVDKQRRAYIIANSTVEQTDFYLRSILAPPSEAKEMETKQPEPLSSSSLSTSTSAASTSTSCLVSSSITSSSSTSSSSSSTITLSPTSSFSSSSSPPSSASSLSASPSSDPLAPWLNRRFRSIAFERAYNIRAATDVVEAIRSTLQPGHSVFVGGYAGFLAHVHGRPQNNPAEKRCSLF